MNWLLFLIASLVSPALIQCQDIVFPDDEETSHVSGNVTVTDRIPVSIPDHCPTNMLLYPGDGNSSAWVCDCRPRFLYFPLNDTCHEAYRQGPCPPQHYVVLGKIEPVPKCERNPCSKDGLVRYNETCYALRTVGGPCGQDAVLGVSESTYEVECISTDVAPFIIIQPPKRDCPIGSRRNALGMCRTQV